MDLWSRFAQECRGQGWWSSADRIVLAVSGGVDSMVLYDLLTRLPEEKRPTVILAHVNHQLREESDEEEEALRQTAKEKDTPFFSAKWPKEEHPATGVEEAARLFRYRFFEEVMKKNGASCLLTAHHRSDQLETVLMRFVRGGRLERMTGIRRVRPFGNGRLIRPLLSFSKDELYAYAHARGVDYYEDTTNSELTFTRNRYRHAIVPLLKKENPSVEEHAEQFARDLEDLLQLAQPLIAQGMQKVSRDTGESLALSRQAFLELEEPLQRFVLIRLLQEALAGTEEATFKRSHLNQIIQWMKEGGPNSRWDFPGSHRMVRAYDMIRFVKGDAAKQQPKKIDERTLSPGEWHTLPDGSRIGLHRTDAFDEAEWRKEGTWIYLDPEHVELPLKIRNRKSGDRMTLKGMQKGTKKVKDIFIDQKVPAQKREEAIVVTDARGEVLWIVNFKESSLSIDVETDTIQYILIFVPYMSKSIKGE